MTKTKNNTVKLIFNGERMVSLPKISELIASACHTGPFELADVSLTGMDLRAEDFTIRLDMAFAQDETILSVDMLDTDDATGPVRLARIAYALAEQLPIGFVIWAGTDLRIPRETFVSGLSAQFGAPQATAKVTQIAPRRVACNTAAKTPRGDASLARMLPLIDKTARVATANANNAASLSFFDAHVRTYEETLRATLIREASDDELEVALQERGPLPVEARLSTWAVSLTVATVSLPVAVPVMAYNLARGEDMRVASLAMALAGFFVALDSSGAMAAVTGF